jgi:hypothetical protein
LKIFYILIFFLAFIYFLFSFRIFSFFTSYITSLIYYSGRSIFTSPSPMKEVKEGGKWRMQSVSVNGMNDPSSFF